MHIESNNLNPAAGASRRAMREAIQNIAVGPDRGRDISRELTSTVMHGILDGEIDDIQTAVFFIALRMKRESIEEFMGVFDALRTSTQAAVAEADELVVLADPFDGYVRTATMTPFIPAVLAACGVNCLMHGVETVGPKHGITAHKVFKLAGINTGQSAEEVAVGIRESDWGYVDQSAYAPALFKLQNLRDRIVKRTALTTLERLIMPIKGRRKTHLVLGYVHNAYPEIYARVAKEARYQSVLLLKGVEGGVAPALNKPLRRFFFDGDLPSDINAEKQLLELEPIFADAQSAAQRLDDTKYPVEQCLELGLNVLNGAKSIARDSLCLASAQILLAHRPDLTLSTAVEKVKMSLDNGAAKECFNAVM